MDADQEAIARAGRPCHDAANGDTGVPPVRDARSHSPAFTRVHLRLIHLLRRILAPAMLAVIVIGLVGQLVRDRFFLAHLMLHAPLLPVAAAAVVSGIVWRGTRRMRATLLVSGVVGLTAGALPMIGWGTPAPPTDAAGREMTIVHWNVRWGGGGGGVDGKPTRWDSIRDDVVRQATDILILSEAPSPQRIAQLTDALGQGWTTAQVRNAPRARYLYSLVV